jgi:hypothetical protein
MGANGKPELMKEPKIEFVDDGPGKPVGINRFIGRRPIFSFGNSDGDLQMLQWTAAGSGARFMGLVHHTDAAREYAYDRKSASGRLDKALDEANAKGWSVVDIKTDWRVIFPEPHTDRTGRKPVRQTRSSNRSSLMPNGSTCAVAKEKLFIRYSGACGHSPARGLFFRNGDDLPTWQVRASRR